MKWIALCLRNKLIVYVLTVVVCIVGLLALYLRPISPFPIIPLNKFNISISYPGANAQTVQRQVTSEVVSQLQSINNVKYISAYSQAGAANIMLELHSGSPLEKLQAHLDIVQAINAAHLPTVVPQPQVVMQSGMSGLIYFVVSSNQLSLFDLSNFIASRLTPTFSALPGVLIQSGSSIDPVVKIKLKPDALAQDQLDPSMIASMINTNYQSAPLGSVTVQGQEYFLNTLDDYDSLVALGNLVVGYTSTNPSSSLQSGLPIYLKDIAELSFEPRSIADQSYSNFNGQAAVSVGLNTQTDANPFAISLASRAYVGSLKNALPADMKITPIFDMASVMMSSIKEVSFTIISASLLVLLVALVFLGRFKTTLIPIITIPVCLMGSVICIALLGFTINLLTLLAMVIAIGLVVDDAIVVVENITRYQEQGLSKYQAVLEGSSSIALTIVGITLTLLAVYLPLVFSGGDTSAMLKPFALTLASAVLISGIVALTLTPVMSLALVDDHPANRYQRWFERVLERIMCVYQKLLGIVFKRATLSICIVVALIVLGSYYTMHLPQMVFAPDPNGDIDIVAQGSPTESLDSLKQKMEQLAPFYRDSKVTYYLISSYKDSDTGMLSLQTKIHYSDRYLKQLSGFADQMNAYIKAHHIKNIYAKMSQFMNWDSGYDIRFYIYGSGGEQSMNATAESVTAILEKSPVFSLVDNNMNLPQKQLAFDIDAVKAQKLGITRTQILNLLSTAFGGAQMNDNFSIAGLSVPIVLQLDTPDLKDPASFQKLMIQSPLTNVNYPLADFVTLKTIAKPLGVTTFNNQFAVSIGLKLNKGYDMSSGIDWINQVMHTQEPMVQYQYVGSAEEFLETNNETLIIALLGILSVYFLLTILFKSLIDPFIIMLTVPFSVVGGALSLYLIGGSLNIFSTLGLITLVGLITKHGVLIVQFANHELKKGATVIDAVLLATRHRFRPIIMTTLAMILGALPLMVSSEIMYVSRQNLAIVIMSGLAIGTLFSLFIVPLVYVLVKRKPRH